MMRPSNPDTEHRCDAVVHTGRRAAAEIARLAATDLAPGLYLVATPIGNLADITIRALAVLAAADIIYCEDTRHSRTLLAHYAIATPTRSYHEHNAESERPRILDRLAAGGRVALISDAGTPLVSDPGHKLVRAAIAAGHVVRAIPGPSAILAALVGAGLASDGFLFAGFLPSRSAARRTRLAELGAAPATLVLFEAPSRLAEALADARDVLGDRHAAIARELTKLHEETVRGTLSELAERYAGHAVKGEIVVLIAPSERGPVEDAEIARQLNAALARTGLNDAAKTVAAALGVPKARVYDIGLGLKKATAGPEPSEDRS